MRWTAVEAYDDILDTSDKINLARGFSIEFAKVYRYKGERTGEMFSYDINGTDASKGVKFINEALEHTICRCNVSPLFTEFEDFGRDCDSIEMVFMSNNKILK